VIPGDLEVGQNALMLDPNQIYKAFNADYSPAYNPDYLRKTLDGLDDIPVRALHPARHRQ
jgi:hypothetical protein